MERRLLTFLDQFPERLVGPMVLALERLRFLDRQELGVNFARFVEETAPGSTNAGLTTDPAKSANLLSYYLADDHGPFGQRKLVHIPGGDDLCLFDDFLMSGKQARTAVQQLLGLRADLDEHLADELAPHEASAFRERRIHFRFAAAHTTGVRALEQLIAEIPLQADVCAMRIIDNDTLKQAMGADEYDELAGFLGDVGYALLTSTKQVEDPVKWTERLCRKRALGYSGFELLVASFYNVPTTTVTALWANGLYRNQPWVPLLPRRSSGGPSSRLP